MFEDNNISGAEFSECRKYRYALWRIWNEGLPLIMFIGLNPSTANEVENDATIRRVISFAKVWNYGGVYMMNCFPYISTNPDDLIVNDDNEENDHWLSIVNAFCETVVFAWGNFPIVRLKERDKQLAGMFPNAKCLVKNKNGSPKHPLYVAKNTKLINYEMEAAKRI